uniref:USP domain-containing protein n=1 Tax=Chromera velia CCMP2878 TaxID=1169474 RepID=A0A0G4HXV2_9ALVE|eukprot:Cvel_9355.t1-p1 / transcript=Cvel_9355.t1 / gene=Cvel_9355 / organism=Chromera_velia_CCMP2878 / gene_product=hypothetical protein / transcript_product=hypothetical protein / location=Cvel_scaffold537:23411-24034(+) / protein_length=208 / sequence_SO=supercontig / SO=protein_coding / is_pseudo=false
MDELFVLHPTAPASLEDLLRSHVERAGSCDECLRCQAGGWEFVEGVWRNVGDRSEIRRSRSTHHLLSLPAVLPIRIQKFTFDHSDSSGRMRQKWLFSEIDIPLVDLDLGPLIPSNFDLGATCTKYNLRMMVKFRYFGNELPEFTDFGMAGEGRFMGYFKEAGSGVWYAFDVCRGVREVAAEMEGARRMTSKFACFLLYVRADVPVDSL